VGAHARGGAACGAACGCSSAHGRKIRGQALNPPVNAVNKHVLHNGVLNWSAQGLLRVYVPEALRAQLLQEFHDAPLGGHLGWRKTNDAMAQHYQWPGMAHEVHRYVTQCAVCQRVKPTRQPRPPLQPLQVPAKPFSQITLDWLGGFPKNKEGNDSVLNIIDKFTQWSIVIPCNEEMTAAKLAELLCNRLFSWVGLPMRMVGERDSRLTSLYMRTLCKHLRVKLKLSTSYHPQTDGQTENFNSTLLQMLRCFVNPFHTD
jgi:Integrase zinc binding domain